MSKLPDECNCFDFISFSVDAIVIVNSQGNISLFNQAAEKMYGWKKEDVIGKKISVLLPPDKVAQHDKLVMEFFQGKYGKLIGTTVDVVGYCQSGNIFPVELTLSKIVIANEQCVMAIVRDVTDKKNHQKELKIKRKKLQKMNKVLEQKLAEKEQELDKLYEAKLKEEKMVILGRALSEISHDIRGPLGVISNGIYMLKMADEAVAPEYHEYLDMMKSEVVKSIKILEGMRYFLKNQKPTLRKVSLQEIINKVLGYLPQAQRDVIEVDFSRIDVVWGDSCHLERVFLNLISNSLDATKKIACPQIKIYSQDEEKFVKVYISDNGVGIQEKDLSKMFEPLFTTKSNGLGIGLASCRNIVNNCGGNISVESVYGQGATFTVKLLAGGGDGSG